MDSSKISYTITSELHMVRHFEQVSDSLAKRFTEAGFTEKEWRPHLSSPGSRFFSSFARELSELFQQIQRGSISETMGANGNQVIEVVFSENDFPQGVGTQGILPLKELKVDETVNIYIQTNRGVPLKHLTVKVLPATNTATVILRPEKGHSLFITAFPGPPAMPLPAAGMNKELYAACEQFWDQHVFLVQH